MVNSITNYGQRILLMGDISGARSAFEAGLAGTGSDTGGFAFVTTRVHLYKTGTTLTKDEAGQTVVEATGGSYAFKTIDETDWTVGIASTNTEIVLDDQVWTASGSSMPDISGAYVTDGDNNVMAWWERTSLVTLADTDSITADDLTIRPT